MSLTIPDKGEGLVDAQSIMWQDHIRLLVQGIKGETGFLSGCEVTASGGMGVATAAGVIRHAGQDIVTTVANTTLASDPTHPRFVQVLVSHATGAASYYSNTPATPPKLFTHTDPQLVAAIIYIPAGAVGLTAANIIDARVFANLAGAKGGGNLCFHENGQTVSQDYTITTGKNAVSAGPITVDTGKTVTVPTGSTWTIV